MLTETESRACGMMEYNMTTVLKWITAGLFAGFVWLVGVYTDEYFRPHKKIRMRTRNK